MGLFSFFNKELAIDLGTANTVIIYNDKVVVDEPSIVAIERDTQKIMAVGKRAMMMHGKTHENIKTVRPLRDGVIADFQAAECMLRDLIKMINFHNSIFPPALKMVICIPSGITEVEERAVQESIMQAGAREVYLIEEPIAAAIGARIDISKPNGNLIVDDNIYVFVIKEMEKYVLNNLITIGKVSVNVNIISIDDIKNINSYIDDIEKLYVIDNTEGESNEARLPKNKKIEYIFENERVPLYEGREEKKEKPAFKPTPIISPIYGILDKDYKMTGIEYIKKAARKRVAFFLLLATTLCIIAFRKQVHYGN